MQTITSAFAKKVRLDVNQEESAVNRPWDRKFPGVHHDSASSPRKYGRARRRIDEGLHFGL